MALSEARAQVFHRAVGEYGDAGHEVVEPQSGVPASGDPLLDDPVFVEPDPVEPHAAGGRDDEFAGREFKSLEQTDSTEGADTLDG